MFEKYFKWSFLTGMGILDARCGRDRGKELVRKLLFEIRGEDTPGRFLEKLVEKLSEYKTNTNIQAPIAILPEIMEKEEWHADKFYYLKASILAGLLNALVLADENRKVDENE